MSPSRRHAHVLSCESFEVALEYMQCAILTG